MIGRAKVAAPFAAAAVAIGIWLFAGQSPEQPVAGTIKVVDAASLPIGTEPSLAQATSRPSPKLIPPAFAALDVVERTRLMDGLPRDPFWSTDAEQRLTAGLAGSIAGLRVEGVRCASGACEVTATIDMPPQADRDNVIRNLLDGRFQRAAAATGFAEDGRMTISLDDVGRLHFTEYLRLAR